MVSPDLRVWCPQISLGACLGLMFLVALSCTPQPEPPYYGNKKVPPEFVAQARRALHGPVVEVWELNYEWFPGEIVSFSTDSDRHVTYLRRGDEYVRVDLKNDYSALNEIISHYRFPRDHFEDPNEVDYFLGLIVGFRQGPRRYVGSSDLIRMLEGESLHRWNEGKVKDERVFRELCRDPIFRFTGEDRWTVMWNVFKEDGSVDQWTAEGRFDQQTQTNQIDTLAMRRIYPKGSFTAGTLG